MVHCWTPNLDLIGEGAGYMSSHFLNLVKFAFFSVLFAPQDEHSPHGDTICHILNGFRHMTIELGPSFQKNNMADHCHF